jgi:hypothetical protein
MNGSNMEKESKENQTVVGFDRFCISSKICQLVRAQGVEGKTAAQTLYSVREGQGMS